MIHPYSIPYPTSQTLLPSSFKPQDYSLKQICTHIWSDSSSLARIWYKIYNANSFLCVYVVIILLYPIYIFLYMNSLKAQIFLSNFSRLYIYILYLLYVYLDYLLDDKNYLFNNLLLHKWQAHGEKCHTKDTIGHREHHDQESHRVRVKT